MTDPILRLEPPRVSVEPGGQGSVTVTVMNPGTIVEGYDLDVVAQTPLPFAEVVPPFLEVYPGQEGTATVVFSPPSGPQAPGGQIAFGVRARSRVDPTSSGVVEGDLEVGRVFGLQAKLTPVTSSGRWRGRHTLAVSNWGNAPARLRLVPSDPDQRLGFLVRPEFLEIPLGSTGVARLKVRTRKPELRGTPTRLPFQVVGEPDPPVPVTGPVSPISDPRRPVVDGAFAQKPILSRIVVVVAGVAALMLIAGTAFALTRSGSTPTYADLGIPDAPKGLALVSRSADSVELTWQKVPSVQNYSMQIDAFVNGGQRVDLRTDEVPADQNLYTASDLEPDNKYCFTLLAVRGDGKLPSDPSNGVCARTKTGAASTTSESSAAGTGGESTGASGSPTSETTTPTTTTSNPSTTGTTPVGGGPTFATTDWIGVVALTQVAVPDSMSQANQLRRQLQNAGLSAGPVFLSDQVPATKQFVPNSSWVVYVGPFSSQGQATVLCQQAASVSTSFSCVRVLQPQAVTPSS